MQHDDIMLYFSDILVYVSVVFCFLLFVYKSYYCSIPQSLDYLLHLDIFFLFWNLLHIWAIHLLPSALPSRPHVLGAVAGAGTGPAVLLYPSYSSSLLSRTEIPISTFTQPRCHNLRSSSFLATSKIDPLLTYSNQ